MSRKTDIWRLAQARCEIDEFLDKFNATDSEVAQRNLAVYYMGKLTAALYMSDQAVMKRAEEREDGQ